MKVPELPEVETVARGVDARVRGERIEHVWLGEKPEPLKSPASLIEKTLTGKQIALVHRVGKTIVVDLKTEETDDHTKTTNLHTKTTRKDPKSLPRNAKKPVKPQAQWLIHLGMTGRLLVCDSTAPTPPHTHAIVRLSSGRELRFVDARRFGRLSVVTEEGGFAGEGREPLTISPEDFIALFRGRRTPIKAALLNQTLLHGVGNIYADESLFRAGIRPRRQAARLSHEELRRLHLALQAVLRSAIQLGGSSVSDYVDADGERGFFQFEHRVYMRTGQPCLVCGTAIRRVVVGGRGTHYCPKCQR
jgi:formamidopyrimidine-DNA glycosylase